MAQKESGFNTGKQKGTSATNGFFLQPVMCPILSQPLRQEHPMSTCLNGPYDQTKLLN